jgi:EAL domain-containing protein (putative c-di-GMP-specific phosphodiesterase class I)
VADVRDALDGSGLDPASLTLEITETVMMTDTDLVVQRLGELKQLGVRLAMDDFGTRYSSLSYLSMFPVDVLKMDRSFLHAGATPEASGLASAVVALGETLDLQVVAEGIELSEQWTTMRDLGCDPGQGFLFSRRWTPTRRLPSCARRACRPRPRSDRASRRGTMHHSYEGLDRPGGFSRVRLISPLRHRDFRLLWSGMCVSLMGDGPSWWRWRGRSTRCPTRPRRCRSSASR